MSHNGPASDRANDGYVRRREPHRDWSAVTAMLEDAPRHKKRQEPASSFTVLAMTQNLPLCGANKPRFFRG